LDDVVDFGNIKASRSHIGANKDASLTVDKLEKGGSTFLLFLFAMDRQYRKIDIVKELGLWKISCVRRGLIDLPSTYVVVDRVAAREKDNDFLFQVSLQERE
jgi:hypothetical protein